MFKPFFKCYRLYDHSVRLLCTKPLREMSDDNRTQGQVLDIRTPNMKNNFVKSILS